MALNYPTQSKLEKLAKKTPGATPTGFPSRMTDMSGVVFGGRGQAFDELKYLRNQNTDASGVNEKDADAGNKFFSANSAGNTDRTISAISQASPTIITTTAAHQLNYNDRIVIAGSNSSISVDGPQSIASINSSTTFTILSNVSVAGTAGNIKFNGPVRWDQAEREFYIQGSFP